MLKKLKRGKLSEHAFDIATGLSSGDEVEEAGTAAEIEAGAAAGNEDDRPEQQAHGGLQSLQPDPQVANGRRHSVGAVGVLQPPLRTAVRQEQQLRKRKKRRQKKRLQQQQESQA
jgi:hypothetical protein